MPKARYKRGKDGAFHATVWDGTYKDGKKNRIHLRSTVSSRDLEEKVHEIKEQVKNKTLVKRNDISVYDYAQSWLETYKAPCERATYRFYRIAVNSLAPWVDLPLQDLSYDHLQRLINDKLEYPRSCAQILATVKQIVNAAVKSRILPQGSADMICGDIKLPKWTVKEKRALTEAEKAAIKKADFTDRERCFVYLIYGCGLRRGEALALTKYDISITDRTITINKSWGSFDGEPYIKGPKTKNGYRTLPMPDFLCDFLADYIHKVDARLITRRNGGDMTHSAYNNMWSSIVKKINIAAGGTKHIQVIHGLTAHIFRHNYCSSLCYQVPAISTRKIAQLLGDDPQMVTEVYSHIIEKQEDVQTAVGNAINL